MGSGSRAVLVETPAGPTPTPAPPPPTSTPPPPANKNGGWQISRPCSPRGILRRYEEAEGKPEGKCSAKRRTFSGRHLPLQRQQRTRPPRQPPQQPPRGTCSSSF